MVRTYAEDQKRMELRNKALAGNAQELPHLEPKRVRLSEVLVEVRTLTVEQASLAARKQEVSKRLAELMKEGNTLVAFLDVGVKQQYGNRSEKLVEFGLQPFRGRPRLVLDAEGKPVKRSRARKEPPPAEPANE